MLIPKTASNPLRALRTARYFPSARKAFSAVLGTLVDQTRRTVLLPGYIGWSAREGSGVFDPVLEQQLPHRFYKLDRNLRVDLENFERCLEMGDIAAVLLIHYFGYCDSNYSEMVRLARKYGALIIEDEAHAMLTDLVSGRAGRAGDVALFSLHKMLPFKSGGVLVVNDLSFKRLLSMGEGRGEVDLFSFDLWTIANTRLENAIFLESRMAELKEDIAPFIELSEGIIPQTFPVIVKRCSRDRLYELMNEKGFGVVSLYHTMVRELPDREFGDAHWVSKRILNLPVHQDVSKDLLDEMVDTLKAMIPKAV